MNRLLVAVAVAAFSVAGCATEVDDPLPQPAPQQEQRDPPRQPLGGEFNDPFAEVAGGLSGARLPPELQPRQNPPVPSLSNAR